MGILFSKPANPASDFDVFSDEMIFQIFSYLNNEQLLLVSLVSKNFKRLANDNHLWCNLFSNAYYQPKYKDTKEYKKIYCDNKKRRFLRKLQYFAQELHKVNHPGQEGAFINLFYTLAFYEKSTVVNENKNDALIGALYFELDCIASNNLIADTSQFYRDINNTLTMLFSKLPDATTQALYLTKFRQCIQHIPEEDLPNEFNQSKALLTSAIDIVCRSTNNAAKKGAHGGQRSTPRSVNYFYQLTRIEQETLENEIYDRQATRKNNL